MRSVVDRVQTLLSVIVTLAAIATGVVLVHREFFGATAGAKHAESAHQPTAVVGWREAVNNGVVIGDSLAKVKLVVFSDLECPVCRSFSSVIRTIHVQQPELAVVFVHYPLTQHRFASVAARASECALKAGRFTEFVDLAYGKQDSMGLKPWSSFAAEAGIPDTAAFVRCTNATEHIARIDSGIAVGHRIGVRGTPTVLVNEWRFDGPPTEAELRSAIAAVARGRAPR